MRVKEINIGKKKSFPTSGFRGGTCYISSLVIDRLEKQNLVERKTDKLDRGYTCLYILEQVKDYIEKLISDYFVPLLAKIKALNKEE
ncbi:MULTISPECIES: hypothetical protein [Bacillus]|uniref:MarR family transcriptional regulator n=2 Tax=Bacillus TaxID=1386 RepID=A0A3D9UY46_BACMY|nr:MULTISPECIES: hypothetical protein [Bacillus]RBP23338.1 hypothetical protein DET63_11386 [Bacillus sp. DB-2]REF34442.1 hypothetical protein DET55_10986 [Bacillus mycoides]